MRAADCGPAAFAAVAEDKPEVVLLDIGLPGMDGYEVARQLRAGPASADLFIVAITGYGQEEDRRRSREAGFDFHLVKPIDIRELEQVIAQRASSERATEKSAS